MALSVKWIQKYVAFAAILVFLVACILKEQFEFYMIDKPFVLTK